MKTNLTIQTVLFSMLIAFFALTGCDKEEDNEPSKTDLIIKEWKVISIDGDPVEDEEILLKFEVNGNLIVQSSDDDGQPVTLTIKWSWGANETTINVLFYGEQLVWKLDKLTADALWLYDEEESFFKMEPKK